MKKILAAAIVSFAALTGVANANQIPAYDAVYDDRTVAKGCYALADYAAVAWDYLPSNFTTDENVLKVNFIRDVAGQIDPTVYDMEWNTIKSIVDEMLSTNNISEEQLRNSVKNNTADRDQYLLVLGIYLHVCNQSAQNV